MKRLAPETPDPARPPRSPFSSLAALRGELPAGPVKEPLKEAAATIELDPVAALLARKLVVRRERKGRGGKTVTLVQFPSGAQPDAALEALAGELRKSLGTSARFVVFEVGGPAGQRQRAVAGRGRQAQVVN